jgi:hypothetical protein
MLLEEKEVEECTFDSGRVMKNLSMLSKKNGLGCYWLRDGYFTLLRPLLLLLPLPVLAAFAGLDGAGGEVGFALGFVVVEGDDDVGE